MINLNDPRPSINMRHFLAIHILLMLGIVLTIVGGTNINISSTGSYEVNAASKVAVGLFIVGLVAIGLVWLVSMRKARRAPRKERRTFLAVGIALPIIAVRVVYSSCVTFLNNSTFNMLNGSVTARVCMAITEEFVVLVIYIVLGFMLDALTPEQTGPIQSGPPRKSGGGRRGLVGLAEQLIPQQRTQEYALGQEEYTMSSQALDPAEGYSPPQSYGRLGG